MIEQDGPALQNKWLIRISLILLLCLGGQCIASAQAKEGSDFERLYNAGQSAMAAGRYEEALADFKQLQTMDPGVAEVHATLAVLYYKSGDFGHAIEEIHAARKLKPGLPGLDTLLALSLAESGQYKESLPGLEKAFHASPDPALKRQAGLELGHVYSTLGMDRKAVETALEMRGLYKSDPEVLYNVGKILGNSAYLTMQDLFHDARDSVWAELARAEAYESQGQVPNAIQAYTNVLALDPHHPDIHYRMGRTYLSRWKMVHEDSDFKSAEAEFSKELEVNPSNANAAYELADLRRTDGDLAAAQRLYESAVESYPTFEEAQVGLGRVLLQENKPALALPHLERATVLSPDDEVAWFKLAQAQRALGDTQAQLLSLAKFKVLHAKTSAALNSALTPQGTNSVTPQQLNAADQNQ
jgi:tetratricopeptide (TPR) repeat protein